MDSMGRVVTAIPRSLIPRSQQRRTVPVVAAVAVTVAVAVAVPTVPAAAARAAASGRVELPLERRHLAHQIQASVRTSFRSQTSETAATAKSPSATPPTRGGPCTGRGLTIGEVPEEGQQEGRAAVKWSAVAGATGYQYRVAKSKAKLTTAGWSSARTSTTLTLKRTAKKRYLEVRAINSGGAGVAARRTIKAK